VDILIVLIVLIVMVGNLIVEDNLIIIEEDILIGYCIPNFNCILVVIVEDVIAVVGI